jgi:hypothetical protein
MIRIVPRPPRGVPRQSAECRRALAARDGHRRGFFGVPPQAAQSIHLERGPLFAPPERRVGQDSRHFRPPPWRAAPPAQRLAASPLARFHGVRRHAGAHTGHFLQRRKLKPRHKLLPRVTDKIPSQVSRVDPSCPTGAPSRTGLAAPAPAQEGLREDTPPLGYLASWTRLNRASTSLQGARHSWRSA